MTTADLNEELPKHLLAIWHGIGDGIRLGNDPGIYSHTLSQHELPQLNSGTQGDVLSWLGALADNIGEESQQERLKRICPMRVSSHGNDYFFFFWNAARIRAGHSQPNRLVFDANVDDTAVRTNLRELIERLDSLPLIHPLEITTGVGHASEIFVRWLNGKRPFASIGNSYDSAGVLVNTARDAPLTVGQCLDCLEILQLANVYANSQRMA